MSLTDLQIKRLKAPEKGQKTYYDDALPGFGVRVSQGGTKTFVVVYGKERRRRSLGRYPELSLSNARTLAKQAQVDITLDDQQPTRKLPKVSFVAARAKFLDDSLTRTRPRTVGEYKRLLTKHFNFDGHLDDLTRQDIAKVVDSLGARRSEQQHAYVAVRTMMNWCVKRGLLDVSPVPPMTFKSKPRERILSDAELVAVWRRAAEFGHPYGRIVQLLILTGQRKGEIVGLRKSWIENGRIVYPSEFVKNERTHTIPLGKQAMELIEALPSKSDLLFPSRFDEERRFNGFSKCKKAFDQNLGIEPYTLHDLRRTFSSAMAKLGTPIHVTERILNHVSGTISGVAAVYNRHAYLNEMADAFAAYELHLAELTASN